MLAHIPMIVCSPAAEAGGQRVSTLTATIDLMPTFLELHAVDIPASVQGVSLAPILRGDSRELHALHDGVLYGYFGKDINLFDGRYSYCLQPLPNSSVHHHTAMPRSFEDFLDRSLLSRADFGTFLQHCDGIPHYRITVPSYRHADAPDFNPIYDLEEDPQQAVPIQNSDLEDGLRMKMQSLLGKYEAPQCQYERTGLHRTSS